MPEDLKCRKCGKSVESSTPGLLRMVRVELDDDGAHDLGPVELFHQKCQPRGGGWRVLDD